MKSSKQMHVSLADTGSVVSEESSSTWGTAGGRRDYGATEGLEQGGQPSPHRRDKQQRRVTFFHNIPSLTIDFGFFAFSSSQRDIAWYSLYCVIYILIAVVAFSFVFEKWSIVDSVYFAVTTFTTTGFGDKVPSTEHGRLFTTVFALYGIIMLGVFIGIVGYAIGKAQDKEIKNLKAQTRKSVLISMFPRHVESLKSIRGKTPAHRAAILSEGTASILLDVQKVCTKAFPLLLAVIVLACILVVLEGWPITSSVYFCIIASTTTGYGDYVPTTHWTKLYCILFVPFAVAIFASTLGRIAGVYIRRKNRMAERKFMRRSITLCDLRSMDTNDDGMVSMEDFLTFMLVALQKVDRELLDELTAVFRSLDRNGNGMLEKDDLLAQSTMGSRDWDLVDDDYEEEEKDPNMSNGEDKARAVSSSKAADVYVS